MDNKLISQLETVLPAGMSIPEEIKLLYQWIESNEFYSDRANGFRVGFLYPEKDLIDSWGETEREGGTIIEFSAEDTEDVKYWFSREENEELKKSLCIFARSGGEGSQCAFWLTEGKLKIVHMGSGSGSCLACVLCDNAIDFLRLLAIGYDEICWDVNFPYEPNDRNGGSDVFVKPNIKFRNWVETTFNIEIPKTALEIVKHPAKFDDKLSEDKFFNWRQKYLK